MQQILIVEDDIITRKILVKALESFNLGIIQASSGSIALRIIEDNPDIALIVTDLMLPELDGRQLVKIIRGNQEWREIPVLMISGVVKLKEITELLTIGVTRFLAKPINVAEFLEYCSQLLHLEPRDIYQTH